MADYIDRNELVGNLDRFAPEHLTPLVRNLIAKQPTADVVEVKHGEWVKAQFVQRSGFRTVRDYICSICGKVYAIEQPCNLMNYCSFCGAKMDGRSDT